MTSNHYIEDDEETVCYNDESYSYSQNSEYDIDNETLVPEYDDYAWQIYMREEGDFDYDDYDDYDDDDDDDYRREVMIDRLQDRF